MVKQSNFVFHFSTPQLKGDVTIFFFQELEQFFVILEMTQVY